MWRRAGAGVARRTPGGRLSARLGVLLDLATAGTHTRASEASFWDDQQATVEWWASGVRRTPIYQGKRYYYHEGASENLLERSQEFDDPAWAQIGAPLPTVEADVAVAPDGTATADRVTFAAGVDQAVRATPTLADNLAYTFSVFARSESGTQTISLATRAKDGTVTQTDRTVTTSWTRIEVTFGSSSGGTTPYAQVQSSVALDAAAVLVWGAQLERQDFPTSYIRTAGAAATRVADDVIIQSAAIPLLFRTGPWEVDLILDHDNTKALVVRPFSIDATSRILRNTSWILVTTAGNAAVSPTWSRRQKLAFLVHPEVKRIRVNALDSGTDVGAPFAAGNLQIGSDSLNNPVYGLLGPIRRAH